jgi:hypothetical protein
LQPKKLPWGPPADPAPAATHDPSLITTGLRFFAGVQRPSAQMLAANKRAHDNLLQLLMQVLGGPNHGFEHLRADLHGWVKPERILSPVTGEGYSPDASAWLWLGFTEYIFEVETAETLSLEHTRHQCQVFSDHARKHGAEFVLVVPLGLQARASRQLTAWGIKAQVW